jgi:hypothetical protein
VSLSELRSPNDARKGLIPIAKELLAKLSNHNFTMKALKGGHAGPPLQKIFILGDGPKPAIFVEPAPALAGKLVLMKFL